MAGIKSPKSVVTPLVLHVQYCIVSHLLGVLSAATLYACTITGRDLLDRQRYDLAEAVLQTTLVNWSRSSSHKGSHMDAVLE